jgi:long-chain fatty acid transport protein
MRIVSSRTALLAGVAFCTVSVGIGEALAGGFAVREQSAYGQGASFAGIAAGGALSGMFWNPAVMTQFSGINFEANVTGILPNAQHTPLAGTFPPLLGLGGVANSGDPALVPATYASWQVSPNLWIGLSINAPFGLTVSFPDLWAGRNYALNTKLKTYNAAPSVAWKINEWISIGAGIQVMYADTSFRTGLAAPGSYAQLSGTGWAFGFTAGATLTPTPTTTIGLGWRSALDLDIDGKANLFPAPVANPVTAELKLPDIATLSIRQKLSPAFTLLGTVEWSNWSRIGTAIAKPGAGGILGFTIPFEYQDGWFFALGGEYLWDEVTTLRAGIGYEISPITDSVRTPRLPDNDRIWASIGMSRTLLPNLILDFGYTHIFVKDAPIDITSTSGNPWWQPGRPDYVGTTKSSVDIISLGIRYKFGEPAPAPVRVTKG